METDYLKTGSSDSEDAAPHKRIRYSILETPESLDILTQLIQLSDNFVYHKSCIQAISCKKFDDVEKINKLRTEDLNKKYCRKLYDKIWNSLPLINFNYDRKVNIIDLNIFVKVINTNDSEVNKFIGGKGCRLVYYGIWDASNRVLSRIEDYLKNSIRITIENPIRYFVTLICGFFIKNFFVLMRSGDIQRIKECYASLENNPDSFC